MFQRERLLRDDNWDAPSLAEELYAMLGLEIPLEHSAPITIDMTGSTEAPYQVKGYSDGDSLISIRRPDGSIFGNILISGGDLTFSSTGETSGSSGSSSTPAAATTTTGRTYPCTIISGSGATYQADVYLSGLSADPTRVTVTHRSIDSEETIPADTKTFVVKSGTQYLLETPVWL